MKSKMIFAAVLSAALGLFAMVPAFAGGFTVGVQQSFNSLNPDMGPVNQTVSQFNNSGSGLTASSFSKSSSSTTNFFVGYQFNLAHFGLGVEAGTADLGNAKVGLKYASQYGFSFSGSIEDKVAVTGYYAALTAGLPLASGRVTPYVKVGAAQLHTSAKYTYADSVVGTYYSQSVSHDQTNGFYAVGLKVRIVSGLSIFGQYADYGTVGNKETSQFKAASTAVGFSYQF